MGFGLICLTPNFRLHVLKASPIGQDDTLNSTKTALDFIMLWALPERPGGSRFWGQIKELSGKPPAILPTPCTAENICEARRPKPRWRPPARQQIGARRVPA